MLNPNWIFLVCIVYVAENLKFSRFENSEQVPATLYYVRKGGVQNGAGKRCRAFVRPFRIPRVPAEFSGKFPPFDGDRSPAMTGWTAYGGVERRRADYVLFTESNKRA